MRRLLVPFIISLGLLPTPIDGGKPESSETATVVKREAAREFWLDGVVEGDQPDHPICPDPGSGGGDTVRRG